MQFLSPWTALLAAAVALPALLLLYFLKLRRQTLRIPSTLLWRRSFEDLQVNAPFQRLRWSMLLLLQLLMLAALLLALAEPLWRGSGGTAARVVIMLDRSASMNAPVQDDASAPGQLPRTRLAAARQSAIDIIDTLGERGGPSQIMLIAFGSTGQVVSTFESNRGVLRDAVNAIAPTDEQSNLEAALNLASAFAGSRDESANADQPPRVVLLSDGNVAAVGDKATYSLRAGEFQFVQVAGESPLGGPRPIDNLGIVALGARRDYEDPTRVVVFARLLNAGPQPIDAIITISLDGRPATTLRASVPAATADTPGEAPLSQAIDLPGGAVITLQHNHRDQLVADDVAAIVVPPPSRLRIALVFPAAGKPDPYLYELLQAMEPARVDAVAADAWSQMDQAQIDSGSRHDLVVFDRVGGQRLPGVPSLSFGGVPAGVNMRPPRDQRGQAILSWDRQHPIMRNLSLDSIVYSGFGALELPESIATPLAWGPDGPIIALLRTRGARHVIVGFAPGKSNWPLHVSSAMFVQNALEFLTLAAGTGGGGGNGLVYQPGSAISVRAAPQAKEIVLEGPGVAFRVPLPIVDRAEESTLSATNPTGENAAISPSDVGSGGARLVTLPALRRAGIYAAKGAMPPHDMLAVSMLSDVESDIRPRDSIIVNAKAAEAISHDQSQSMPLWPWLLGVAMALAVLEWLTYCRRVG